MLKRLLELEGKSQDILEISVWLFTMSEAFHSSKDLELTTSVYFIAKKPFGQARIQLEFTRGAQPINIIHIFT